MQVWRQVVSRLSYSDLGLDSKFVESGRSLLEFQKESQHYLETNYYVSVSEFSVQTNYSHH